MSIFVARLATVIVSCVSASSNAVQMGFEPIKLELVSEGRIDLDGYADPTLPVERLSDVDLVAEKLLANEDRFLDDASLARDAIDLMLLEHELGGLPTIVWEKAIGGYGPSVEVSWQRALERLRQEPEKLARFFDTMSLLPVARTIIQDRLASLAGTGGAEGDAR